MDRHALTLTVLLLVTLPTAAAAAERQWAETYSLAVDGRIALSNLNGDVEIVAWDRDVVQVEATIRGDARAIEEVDIEVDAAPGFLEIETEYGHRSRSWDDHAEVEYHLQVPRGARLSEISLVNGSLRLVDVAGDVEVSLVNGGLDARGLAGNAELSTVNGGVDLHVDSLGSDQRIEVDSVNGSIDLVLPADADAEIQAETVHGHIRNDFGFEVEREDFVGHEMRGVLGAGSGRLILDNVNGSIDIRRN